MFYFFGALSESKQLTTFILKNSGVQPPKSHPRPVDGVPGNGVFGPAWGPTLARKHDLTENGTRRQKHDKQ